MWSDYLMPNYDGHQKYRKDAQTDLLSNQRSYNHYVDNGEDDDPDAESQGHVVQCPGCPAVPLRTRPVPNVVGFTGLRVR